MTRFLLLRNCIKGFFDEGKHKQFRFETSCSAQKHKLTKNFQT